MHDRLTPTAALAALEKVETSFAAIFRHGSLEVEIYRPVGVDPQTPHRRDELYVVIAGSGQFVCDGVRRPFEPGEVLFVPAGMEHRFEGFSEDFCTWVFFYGPDGGEVG
ncbi:cupin domain-containing protein [Dyella subtropica]|uniref:cupin domain-containing protein n=1 Tax=Dyella subtropica TaxID=2992127 RepID=UPI0022589281|nr:cupin domain-containing protein [Dyella subtropica]